MFTTTPFHKKLEHISSSTSSLFFTYRTLSDFQFSSLVFCAFLSACAQNLCFSKPLKVNACSIFFTIFLLFGLIDLFVSLIFVLLVLVLFFFFLFSFFFFTFSQNCRFNLHDLSNILMLIFGVKFFVIIYLFVFLYIVENWLWSQLNDLGKRLIDN